MTFVISWAQRSSRDRAEPLEDPAALPIGLEGKSGPQVTSCHRGPAPHLEDPRWATSLPDGPPCHWSQGLLKKELLRASSGHAEGPCGPQFPVWKSRGLSWLAVSCSSQSDIAGVENSPHPSCPTATPSPSLREKKKKKTPPPTPSNPSPAYTTQLSSLSVPLGDDGNVNLNRVMLKEHYLA